MNDKIRIAITFAYLIEGSWKAAGDRLEIKWGTLRMDRWRNSRRWERAYIFCYRCVSESIVDEKEILDRTYMLGTPVVGENFEKKLDMLKKLLRLLPKTPLPHWFKFERTQRSAIPDILISNSEPVKNIAASLSVDIDLVVKVLKDFGFY